MVRIINIDTKTRTIRVSNADGDIKTWRTTESGTHFPIKEGQTTKEALDKFISKKRSADPEKHLRSLWDKKEKAGIGVQTAKEQGGDVSKAKENYFKAEKAFKDAKEKQSGPDKNADVSDIITDYKKKMKALGPRASIRKTDRIEADAIKEFMTRKLGANRPYDDYYNYWLSGMDKATKDAFNEIYNESEAREMAFSELASDVDHSGMARGEPTYDELEQWSQKQKAKKAQQQPAKASSEKTKEIDAKIKDKKKELQNIIRSLSENVEGGYFDIAQEMMTDVEYVKGELQQLLDERKKLQQQPAKKEPKPAEKKEAPKPAKKERNWWRGPREDEDAYFDRRDKTLAEARKIDKVSDWYKKAYAGDDAFPKNKDITFQQMSDDLLSGKMTDFYETVGVGESDVREKLFTELTERTGRPYDDFYLSWLYGGLENAQKEARGTKFRKDPKLGLTTGRPTKK